MKARGVDLSLQTTRQGHLGARSLHTHHPGTDWGSRQGSPKARRLSLCLPTVSLNSYSGHVPLLSLRFLDTGARLAFRGPRVAGTLSRSALAKSRV